MAARTKSLTALLILVAICAYVGRGSRADQAQASSPATAARIVSLVPALTEMLFAIGAGPQVIAVSTYDDFPPEAQRLPRVGSLLDPDVERILALRPDLVVTYGSQDALEAQLAGAGIRTYSYRHGGLASLFTTMTELGAASGRPAEAGRAVTGIRRQLDAVRARVRGRPRPRVLLVFGRGPRSLTQIYVSGGAGFLHEMLEIAGGANVFSDVTRESVQPSSETILARAPDVILEIHENRTIQGAEAVRERAAWGALSTIPAVRSGRIYFLSGDYLTVPGPRVGLATDAFARVLHPEVFP